MTNSIPAQATHTNTIQSTVSLKTQAGSPKLDIVSLAKYQGLIHMIYETKANINYLTNTLSKSYHHANYLAQCSDRLKIYEQELIQLERANEIADELKLIPVGMKIKICGEVLTVSSHFISEDGELWAGLRNGKSQSVCLPVKSWLRDIRKKSNVNPQETK